MEQGTDTPVLVVDASVAPDSIGDAHFGQASLCNLMSGAHTCSLCCSIVESFWSMDVCLAAAAKTFESARELINRGVGAPWLHNLPSMFLGDSETPGDEKGFGHAHIRPDFALHGDTSRIPFPDGDVIMRE